jgi:hypothetical protein
MPLTHACTDTHTQPKEVSVIRQDGKQTEEGREARSRVDGPRSGS